MKRPHASGPGGAVLVEVSVSALQAALDADPRPVRHIEEDGGLSKDAIRHVLRRGRCLVGTFDALCRVLNLDDYELEAF